MTITTLTGWESAGLTALLVLALFIVAAYATRCRESDKRASMPKGSAEAEERV